MNQFTGVNIINTYSKLIYKNLKLSDPELLVTIQGWTFFLGSLVTPFLINRLGRKSLMSIGIFNISFSHLLNLFGQVFEIGGIVLFSMNFYLFMFTISLGGVLIVYQVEILSSKLVPLATITRFFGLVFISYFTVPLIDGVGFFAVESGVFFISLFGWFMFEGYAVESQGKTKLEIENDFLKAGFFK